MPNAAAVAYEVFLRLGSLLGGDWAARAEKPLESLVVDAIRLPMAQGHAVGVLDRLVRGAVEIVLVGPHGDPALLALGAAALATYVPNRVIAWLDPTDAASRAACAALAEGKVDTAASKVPAAYVCRGSTCSLPVTTAEELVALLAAG